MLLELKKLDIESRDVIIESYENTEFVVFVNSYRQYNHSPIHFFALSIIFETLILNRF